MTGAQGLVGSALRSRLTDAGCQVTELTRSARPGALTWNPHGSWDASPLDGFDAVVHLAGESVAQPWTSARKQAILESRSAGTASLCSALAGLAHPPPTLICASAIGLYGDRGDTLLDEQSGSGEGFLAEVVKAWEAAAEPAREAGLRVVHLRLGVVLSPRGGALAKMLGPFRAGLGGPVGGGGQYMSWISLDDATRAFEFVLENDETRGAYNLVSPSPVTNGAFTAALGRALRRPACIPLPRLAVSTLFGQMGREVLLFSQRVSSARLSAAGFDFNDTQIDDTLRRILASP